MSSTLDRDNVVATLQREHAAALEQRAKRQAAREQSEQQAAPKGWRSFKEADHFQHAYLAISPGQGALLYMLARACHARTIVEFGSSFGISTLYLAAAAEDNDGTVIGSEYYANKREHALANLNDAGLDHRVEIRLGDAMETLSELPTPIDFVFLDGDKSLYQPVLDMLRPKLKPNAFVVADNLNHFAGEPGDFRHTLLSNPAFTSRIMSLEKGEISVSQYHGE
ncbi:O-methyltransferase [Vreelandella venusta]|uniref:O-methyltransferase n=1 Tax=Vreelandella venusta TaxID=44935 RepID=UPI0018DAD93E|nr:class I SAM-dependent methyltransferase [Halomonas venusta]QPI63243.1 class I SAM-dependent methyltransferase [Halomonas venusta]